MEWNRVARAWRRVVDYVKSKLEDENGERDDQSRGGSAWRNDDRPGFPQVRQPAYARIPK